ncbi:MAG: molecular chaperone DnaJ [Rhodobacteraceae bacterium]|nr:molecular chaperone DnaJ [Paracoccaceae bacterium]
MSKDPYVTLGVSRTASQDDIKAAYRKLAKSLHPDLHPDDPEKQAAFQAVTAAHDLLRDPEKRRRFDAGEIDSSGQERAQAYHRQYAGHEDASAFTEGFARQGYGRGYGPGFGGKADDNLQDLFSDFFGQRARAGMRPKPAAKGADLRYEIEVDFLDAARGAKRKVTMSDGAFIEIAIPAGVRDGQTLRLRGKGAPGTGPAPAGDALVTVTVKPHPIFTREGDDIALDLPITLDEAVLGARVSVPTISGKLTMTIPEGASSGRRLRLKGKGIQRGTTTGDQVVRLKIVLPKEIDDDIREIAERWRAVSDFDPRADMETKVC